MKESMDDKINRLQSMGYWIKIKKPHIVIILKTGETNFNGEMSIEEFKEKRDSVEYLIDGINKEIQNYLR